MRWLRPEVILEDERHVIVQRFADVSGVLYKLLHLQHHTFGTTQAKVSVHRLAHDWVIVFESGWVPYQVGADLIQSILGASTPEEGIVLFLL